MAICRFRLDEMKKCLDQTSYAYLQGSEEDFCFDWSKNYYPLNNNVSAHHKGKLH